MLGTYARRALAGAGIALTIAAGVTACGGSDNSASSGTIDKAALTKKLHEESALKGRSPKYIDCVSQMVVKFGDAARVHAYLDGKTSYADTDVVRGQANKAKASQDLIACLK